MKKFNCQYCDKELGRCYTLKKHELRCKFNKEKLSYPCILCEKTFTRPDNLKRHVSNKICVNNGTMNNAGIINNNNITNNITINITPHVNAFGREQTQYLYNNPDFIKRCIFQALPGILNLIKARNFNTKHPENMNIQKENKRDEFVQVFTGKKWENKLKEDIIEDLFRNTTNITEDLIDKHLNGDDFDDDSIDKLTGVKREQFIKQIQAYVSIMKTMGIEIDEEIIGHNPGGNLTKPKIIKILDEHIYHNSQKDLEKEQLRKENKLLRSELKRLKQNT